MKRVIAGTVAALSLAVLLSGCGGGSSRATLYMLFDSSQSSSAFIREGYRNGAILAGNSFCNSHPGNGEIVFNVITAASETDSTFVSLECPERKNETDFRAKMLDFRPRLAATVDEFIPIQAATRGSDIIDAILYGANESFRRFDAPTKYLVVFSDMQQSGDGVRNCVKHERMLAARCMDSYFGRKPDLRRNEKSLQGVSVFVSGVGKTIRGSLDDDERRAYKAFWRAFFREQDATVCWYEPANLPAVRTDDGSETVNPAYFGSDCRSTL